MKLFSDLQRLTKLRYLNLSGNSFIGNDILESLGKLAFLEVINFYGTNMSGVLHNAGTDLIRTFWLLLFLFFW